MTSRILHAGTEVASGVGAPTDTAGELASRVTLTVDAGTPVVVVEGSRDGTAWAPVSGALVPGTPLRLYGLPRRLRAAWTGAGTFTLTAETRALFASPEAVRACARAAGDDGPLAAVTDDALEEHIEAATAEVLSAFQTAQFKLPIYAVGADTRRKTADLACLYAMRSIGFSPDGEADLFVKAHDDAQAWLRRVAREGLRPLGVEDATPTRYDGGAAIAFRPRTVH